MTVSRGESVTLNCSTDAGPDSRFVWLKNGTGFCEDCRNELNLTEIGKYCNNFYILLVTIIIAFPFLLLKTLIQFLLLQLHQLQYLTSQLQLMALNTNALSSMRLALESTLQLFLSSQPLFFILKVLR